jgi:hypothetical protein
MESSANAATNFQSTENAFVEQAGVSVEVCSQLKRANSVSGITICSQLKKGRSFGVRSAVNCTGCSLSRCYSSQPVGIFVHAINLDKLKYDHKNCTKRRAGHPGVYRLSDKHQLRKSDVTAFVPVGLRACSTRKLLICRWGSNRL